MTAVYDNKHFILFPLQKTKTVLKFCRTCKTLKPFIQFNKYPWNTYFFRTYCKPCEHDKYEKRKVRIEKLNQKYIAQGLSKSSIKQLLIKKYFSDSINTQSLFILKTCLQYEMVIVLWVSLCRLSCVFFHSI